jgi:DNA invertase Pin-like site-specific DNA recombinase
MYVDPEGVMATRVVGYIRVSSREQAEDGISLAAQRAKIQAYAVAMDLDLIAIEEDAGISAKTVVDRPGLVRALGMLENSQADGILVAKLDRLTRSVRDLGDLVEHYFASKWSLLSVSDSIDTRTAAGRLVLNVLTSVAQWEREATGERTRDALAHLKAEGVLVGGVPLGVRRTGELDAEGRRVVVRDESESAAVKRMTELRLAGGSLREIAGDRPPLSWTPQKAQRCARSVRCQSERHRRSEGRSHRRSRPRLYGSARLATGRSDRSQSTWV